MFEIDRNKCYRLISVSDHNGDSKIETMDFYEARIDCIATNIRAEEYHGYNVLRMDFIRDWNGRRINRRLRTSPVTDIQENDGALLVYTTNSVYTFDSAELPPIEYQDAARLIELYLNGEDTCFVGGYFYDENKTPHELHCTPHIGTFQDSCLICMDGRIICRYFPHWRDVEFYQTLYKQDDYTIPMLIHNEADHPLRIKFQRFDAVWTIEPGCSKQITPFCVDGADESEDNHE